MTLGAKAARSTSDSGRRKEGRMPSDVRGKVSLFDRFASMAARTVAGAWFFAFCVLLVVVWLPSYFLFQKIDTWQLVINTLTTIVTFLLVALLQNTQTRADEAVQQKLNAIADALGDLMDQLADERADLRRDREELRAAVGLEDREGSS
jgi:low affinity Fe/Cu permease